MLAHLAIGPMCQSDARKLADLATPCGTAYLAKRHRAKESPACEYFLHWRSNNILGGVRSVTYGVECEALKQELKYLQRVLAGKKCSG